MLIDRVRQTIGRYGLASPDTKVVVALSGGSDSVALAYVLRELDRAGGLQVVALAHFNHRLRAAADDDERFVAEVASSLGLPLDVAQEDVGRRAREERRSIEHAAHRARYAFFARVQAERAADVVALGHTRDDQAETFLLRLLRGAGPKGLAGIYPRAGFVIRPLLECRRAELREYLAALKVTYREDASNEDVSIPRNRIRAELMPLLERRFNPSIVETLASEAELARDDWDLLTETADQLGPGLMTRADGRWALDCLMLRRQPVAIRRLLIWRAMTEAASGGGGVAFKHVQAALELVEGVAEGGLDGPRQRVERLGDQLVLSTRAAGARGRPLRQRPNLFRYSLSIPGEVAVPEAGCLISAETNGPGATLPRAGQGDEPTVQVRRDACGAELGVRNRRPGDRFQPVGLAGHKKLQDYFVDRKVAQAYRDLVPIVVDDRDRIVWVAGLGIDEAFRVTEAAQGVITLKLRHFGGRG